MHCFRPTLCVIAGTDQRKAWLSALSSLWWRKKSAMLTQSWTIRSDRGSSLSSKPRWVRPTACFPSALPSCLKLHVLLLLQCELVYQCMCLIWTLSFSGQSWGWWWSHVHWWDFLHSTGVWPATHSGLGNGHRSSRNVPHWLQQYQGRRSDGSSC